MSLAGRIEAGVLAGFPRVSGDEPALDLTLDNETEFSPRERG